VDCIYEGDTQLFIHPTSASTAGRVSRVCPVKAIFAEMRPRTSGELHRAQQENGSKTCLLPI